MATDEQQRSPSTGSSSLLSKIVGAVIALATASSVPWWWPAQSKRDSGSGSESMEAKAAPRPQETTEPAPTPRYQAPVQEPVPAPVPVPVLVAPIQTYTPHAVPMNRAGFVLSGSPDNEEQTIGAIGQDECFSRCSAAQTCIAATWGNRAGQANYCNEYHDGLVRVQGEPGDVSAIKSGYVLPN